MKLSTLIVALASATLLTSSVGWAAEEANQTDIDKKAFLRAQKAASAQTWTAALNVLKSIDVNKIDDVDVITYVDFSTRCAALAEELGLDRGSNPTETKQTLAEMDFAKLFASMWDIIENKGITEAAKVVVEARRIQKQVPMYLELDRKLTNKYAGG